MSETVTEAKKLLEKRRVEIQGELDQVERALRGLGWKKRGRPPARGATKRT